MIEVGRLKLRPPRGNELVNQIPPTSVSNCIEESIAENGKVRTKMKKQKKKQSHILTKPERKTNKVELQEDCKKVKVETKHFILLPSSEHPQKNYVDFTL